MLLRQDPRLAEGEEGERFHSLRRRDLQLAGVGEEQFRSPGEVEAGQSRSLGEVVVAAERFRSLEVVVVVEEEQHHTLPPLGLREAVEEERSHLLRQQGLQREVVVVVEQRYKLLLLPPLCLRGVV